MNVFEINLEYGKKLRKVAKSCEKLQKVVKIMIVEIHV